MSKRIAVGAAAGIAIAAVSSATAPAVGLVGGAIAAATISVLVTALYMVLVPLKHNNGAKRLVGLLIAIDALLVTTLVNYFFREHVPLRREIVTAEFWALAFALAYLGWHIWKDQYEGARRYQRARAAEKRRQRESKP
ncbi:membrane protein [Arthrobacter phage Shambre1]|uniref:Membrane protein n=1 Tax=Arthrobacter phage Shambre1 TaxID=2927284 RepID=A0A977KPN3_9CAUD|nr:membrane protein [Arthrobacter phage Shambre1]UXE04762.1 membrane protein [Arthrobacter phage Shambre1]